ncbi:MAG: Rpn family recombination-promoting nuclease/putative transposase [Planctomycetota bacterium]
MQVRYINPFTDFGFKKLFGEEESKPLLMDFLNQLLPLTSPIISLEYRNLEQLGLTAYDRKAVFDIYCIDELGRHFIVEMQKAHQNFFKDRAVFYSTFPIQRQAEKGKWDFRLEAVYCVGLLDFVFEEEEDKVEYFHEVNLKNQRNEVFYEKLTFFFIEMPKFEKAEAELASGLEQWLYCLKHLEEFERIPSSLDAPIFQRFFEQAELAKLSQEERECYEESLKVYRDLHNVIETARLEGKEEGRLEVQEETALKLFRKGFNLEEISELTGLSEPELLKLRTSHPN